MEELKMLIVEDDDTQISSYIDVINQYNKTSSVKIIPEAKKTFEEGEALLKSHYYDAAIIDLKLASNTLEHRGVELVNNINGKLRIPLYVISASLGEIANIPENILLQKRSRTDSFKKNIEEIVDIYNSGITKLLRPNSFVDNVLTKIFWNHLPPILIEFIKEKKAKADWDIEKVLLRYISSHLNEYLEVNAETSFDSYNSIEFYIKPAVKEHLITGNILLKKDDKTRWVVLTPVCDLVLYKNPKTPDLPGTPKAKFITIASINEYAAVTGGRSSNDVTALRRNSLDYKYHFLPDNILFKGGGFINFQEIHSIPVAAVNNDFERELVISYPFKKDIISRFSTYYSRQGQPVIE